ncbi:unnamed protein product [Lymnaea stagnalis]|uniref:Small ribosomal subunit protein mS40 n=1 Tax=Lymnaea stagnalis TaxID=6523 RepID=A0AAV2HDK9_LYMST
MAAPLNLMKWSHATRIFANKSCLALCRSFTLTQKHHQDESTPVEDKGNVQVKPKKVIDVGTSIRYMNSDAYIQGYGDKPVWFHYRRNFKGQYPPQTREKCIRAGEIATASPCPICRDEYLVLDATNTKLLEQFISPYSGEILESKKTGLCQEKHKKLTVEIMKAWDEGNLEANVPFRSYDYEDYKN